MRIRTLAVTAMLLALPAAAGAQATPAAKNAQPAAARDSMSDEAKVRAELEKISKRLKLTDTQRTQLRNELSDEYQRLDALMDRFEGEAKTIMTNSRARMRAVLTPAQQAEWDKMKHEYREQFRASAGGTSPKS